jgi:hypothetical protein
MLKYITNNILHYIVLGLILCAANAADSNSTAGKQLGTAAIIISNRAGTAYEKKQAVLEDQISAKMGELGLRVISREIVQGNLRSFLTASSSQNKESSASSSGAEDAMMDQASALSLAQHLHVDYLLHVSIGAATASEKTINAYGSKLINKEYVLSASYKLLDASAGGTLFGDVIRVTKTEQLNANSSTAQYGMNDELLAQVADQVAVSFKTRLNAGQLAKAEGDNLPVKININLECAELKIPDIRINNENVVVSSGDLFPAFPGSVVVEVDGVVVGSAPGNMKVRPGLRRLRLSRPGFESWEKTINAIEGLALTIPLKITASELERWGQLTQYISKLKEGVKLTDAQVKIMEGEASMLESSGYRIDVKIDTKENFRFLVPHSLISAP